MARTSGGLGSSASIIPGTGLVADGGLTDNTARLQGLELLAHLTGGGWVDIPDPGGSAYGCNFTSSFHNVKWRGVGINNPSTGVRATTFCGLVALAGVQNSVWDNEHNNTGFWFMDFDAGTFGRDGIGATAYQADKALIDNGTDTEYVDTSPRNGMTVAWYQTANAKRTKWDFIRPSQPIGSNNPTYYVKRTITGNIVAGGFQFTATDSNTFTAPSVPATPWTSISDFGHQISGPGITPGTYVLTINSATNVTLSQKCAVATGIVITQYQADCCWINGSDCNGGISVLNFGTKRLQGSGQIGVVHCTWSGLSGCINTIIEGGSTYQIDNLYTDSSPAPPQTYVDGVENSTTTFTSATATFTAADNGNLIAGPGIPNGTTMTFVNSTTVTLSNAATQTASGLTFYVYGRAPLSGTGLGYTADSPPLCHTQITSGPGTATASTNITSYQAFQNTTGNSQVMIIENDTSCSVNITSGIVHSNLAQQFLAICAQTWGNNSSFQFNLVNFNSANALKSTGGQPNSFRTGTSTYSGAAYGITAGSMSYNIAGTMYGAASSFASGFTTPPVSGTAYQNTTGFPVYLFCSYTTTAIGGTCIVAISPDNVTYTTLGGTQAPGVSGAVEAVNAIVPPGWWYKFTVASATLGVLSVLG